LAPDLAQIGEVEVSAERNFVQIGVDRNVYSTRDQITASGGSTTDVLRNIPSVDVDIDGNVSLRGNSNVAIQINGRAVPVTGESLAALLQQLPGDGVDRVEVIPNPSAKFDPEGMSGIINIVLKEETELGLNGTAQGGAGTQGGYNAGVNVNYQRGRSNLFVNYAFRNDQRETVSDNFRENFFTEETTFLSQDGSGDRQRMSHLFNVSYDYTLSRNARIGLSTIISLRNSDDEEFQASSFLDASRDPFRRYDRFNLEDEDGLNTEYALTYDLNVGGASDHTVKAELSFNRSTEEEIENIEQINFNPDGSRSDLIAPLERATTDDTNDQFIAGLDYTRPFPGGQKLEAGYRSTIRLIDTSFFGETQAPGEAFEPTVGLNNQFDYEEQVHAVYTTFEQPIGKFTVQAGLRAESALTTSELITTDETFENDYFTLYPSMFVNYALGETQSIRASYSKRVNRPRTRALNPFASVEDPLNIRRGNPFLDPEFIHAVEVGYNRFSERGTFSVTPYFRRTYNTIQRVKVVDANGVSTTTRENFDTEDSWGLELIGTLRFGRRLNLVASGNAFREQTDAANVDANLSNSAFGWFVRGNASVQITPVLDLQITQFYRAPREVALGRIGAFYLTSFALRQKLMNNRANLSLRVNDAFDTLGFNFDVGDEFFRQESTRRWGAREAYLTFTYNFGDQNRSNQRRNRSRGDFDGGDMGGGID
ncbi:MAG: outer membrane beta-barrel family protein, partial [Bacteroidota bacterium]